MKKLVFIILLCCGTVRGSNLADTTVSVGLHGYTTSADITAVGRTYVDTDRPVLTAGKLSRIKMRHFSNVDATLVLLSVVRGAASPFAMVAVYDITADINLATLAESPRFDYDTAVDYGNGVLDLGDVDILVGDKIAMYTEGANGIFIGLESTSGQGSLYEVANELDGTIGVSDVTVSNAAATTSMVADIYVTTSESILFDDSVQKVAGDDIYIPVPETDTYAVIFEGVSVPDTESLEISTFVVNTSNGADLADNNIFIDMSQAPGLDVFALRDDGDVVLGSSLVTLIAGDLYTVILTANPGDTGPLVKGERVNYVNYVNGQGPVDSSADSADIANVSLTAWDWGTRSGSGRLRKFSLVNAGGNATIERVVVARRSVVVVGDSFTSKHTPPTQLSGAAEKLAEPGRWSEDRYVINGGITGNGNNFDGSDATSIPHRFDSFGLDLWTMNNSTYIFVNGPGINDIVVAALRPTTTAEAKSIGEGLGWNVAKMASRVLTDGSNVVLNECCFIEAGFVTTGDIDLMNEAVRVFNETLATVSFELQIPIAKTASTILANADAFYGADHLHLTSAGYDFMADAIVTACENNTISSDPSGSSTYGGFGSIYGGN